MRNSNSKIEVINCGICGTMFAACVDRSQDKQWEKNKKQYIQRGDKVSIVENERVQLNSCDCRKKTKKQAKSFAAQDNGQTLNLF